jgi:hypothetical protein
MSRTCVRHPATLITRSSSLARNTKAKLPNAGPREGPAGSIPGQGLITSSFSGLHPKGFARRVAAGLCSGAGAAGSRPTSSATSMTGTSTHTTIPTRLTSCQNNHRNTADVQPRPTTSKTPWTSRLPRYVLRRRKTGGSSGASNQSRVNRGVSGTREVPSYFLSQFRGSPEYPGRLGHTVSTNENPAVQALTRRTYPSRVFRPTLDVVGRRGWSYV